MRIRKGKRCLPLAPADRAFVERGDDGKVKEYALLRLVALATTTAPGGDGISGRRRVEYLVLLIIAECL